MYTNKQLTPTGRGRRSYSPEFKAQLVAACRIPGMSVASVARNHGINHNILHRWLRELSDSGHRKSRWDGRTLTYITTQRQHLLLAGPWRWLQMK
ncbi:transposase [Rhodoferax sp. TBRC 17198]|uniref:transposase n=1 Tax=Rhodoferax potami TaxID=3068338 RepID=UPI0028BEAE2F|nr:transposase [Rhodoferax sp. TBRC 17198]MDT7524474.1 transposase [Rhodoferax sp. TBRC 17198]